MRIETEIAMILDWHKKEELQTAGCVKRICALFKMNENKTAKIVVDKDDSLVELLLSLGYSKRAGTCAYPERRKTIVIIPSKKWFWYETDIKRGYTKIKSL